MNVKVPQNIFVGICEKCHTHVRVMNRETGTLELHRDGQNTPCEPRTRRGRHLLRKAMPGSIHEIPRGDFKPGVSIDASI